jgi:hypothetical protein
MSAFYKKTLSTTDILDICMKNEFKMFCQLSLFETNIIGGNLNNTKYYIKYNKYKTKYIKLKKNNFIIL